MMLARDEELAGRLEPTVRQLEELPASESPESFFLLRNSCSARTSLYANLTVALIYSYQSPIQFLEDWIMNQHEQKMAA